MSFTTNLRKTINAALLDVGYPVYYSEADNHAAFPYIIYDLTVLSQNDEVPYCELELNIVDYGRDTSRAENICDSIETALDHVVYDANDVIFTPYFERKNNVTSEDRNIIRRRMLFNFNAYNKEV